MNHSIKMHSIKLNLGDFTTALAYQCFYINGQRILVMIDKTGDGPLMSLTNACPSVINFIFNKEKQANNPIPNLAIYQDSSNEWCEVVLAQDRFAGYKHLKGSSIGTPIGEAIDLCVYSCVH